MTNIARISDVSLSENADVIKELAKIREGLNTVLRGKNEVIETILCALACQGHVLLEDVPGVGKTTAIRALAKLLGLQMSRIQCTSDLLPSDILGVEVYSQQKDTFTFHKGPIFSSIVFVDELNRCSPRTQSALLEAMAEGSVTINRKVHSLGRPFIVFATQNPAEFTGTYALPESQLDRFAAKLKIGYPEREKEKQIFLDAKQDAIAQVPANVVSDGFVLALEALAENIQVSERLVNYAMRFVENTRQHEAILAGVSTRGAVSWMRMAKARALLEKRDYVIPDDLQALALRVLAHRLVLKGSADAGSVLAEIQKQTPIE